MRERNDRRLFGVLWFLLPFAAAVRTLGGAALADDSPETIAAMVALEHQHPPGYPFLTLLGRLALMVPAGGVAFRANLLAAACVGVAAWLTGRAARRVAVRCGRGEFPALAAGTVAALMFALARTVWEQAVSAKGAVYGLNACVLAGGVDLALAVEAGELAVGRALALGGWLSGIGVANHWMSVVAAAPAFGLAAASAGGGWSGAMARLGRSRRSLLVLLVFVGIGKTAYLLLPIRATTPLRLNWTRPHTFSRFAEHVSRAQYAVIEFGKRPDNYWGARVIHLARVGGAQWGWWLLPLGVLGGAALVAARAGAAGALLFGMLACIGGGVLVLAAPPLTRLYITEPYLVPALQAWAVLAGLGVAWGLRFVPRAREAMAWACAALIGGGLYLAHAPVVDASRNYLSYDYGWNLLLVAPPGAVIFCEGDYDLFALLEQVEAEGRRPDVEVAAAVFLDYDWYRETAHRRMPDVIPREHELLTYTVRPVRPLVYTSQHGGGEGVLRPIGLVLRPPLGTGYGLDDSARAWRATRFRGLWKWWADGPPLARDLIASYAVQMDRLGVAARGPDLALAVAAFLKGVRLPQEMAVRVMSRYNLAQMLIQGGPGGAAGRARALVAAQGQLEAITAEAPGFWRAHLLLGNLAFLKGDRPGARAALLRALEGLPRAGADADRGRVERLLAGLDKMGNQ